MRAERSLSSKFWIASHDRVYILAVPSPDKKTVLMPRMMTTELRKCYGTKARFALIGEGTVERLPAVSRKRLRAA